MSAKRMELRDRIAQSRRASLGWLGSMVIPGSGNTAFRFSALHDPQVWPGMVLPATYDAVNCLVLLGGFSPEAGYDAGRTAAFINSFQTESGAFRLPGMRDEDSFKRLDPAYTREYIDFHATNYSMGALRSIGSRETRPFAFMEPYLNRGGLKSWMAKRGWDDPWMEGNAVVNLGGFYLAMMEDGVAAAAERLVELLDWLDEIQDPGTGFWGGNFATRKELLFAFAGAMHSYHLYYYLDRPLKYLDRITDACLSLARGELGGVTSACLDVDIVDALANMHRYGLRRDEIETLLERKLLDLLDFQNPDGGFADESPADDREARLRFDGWVKGYSEPQGHSNCFATWFRCATIGMIDCVLFPGDAGAWTFRNTVGIGYFRRPA